MPLQTFDFEKPIVEIEERLEALRAEPVEGEEGEEIEDHSEEIAELEQQLEERRREIYGNLSPWDRVKLARHMARPRSLDLVEMMMTEWVEIKGDRGFRDDSAAICGLARLNGRPVAVIGQQKGRDTEENVHRNFGMMHPEGYRKAMRLMRTAERFNLPIVILIDTAGAYPGLGSEERGVAEAIARNIMEMFTVRTPIVGAVIGEGGSGGALGIGVVDSLLMMENSWYCVISPEGCASILWRDAAMAPRAAEALRITAPYLVEIGIVDQIVPEPMGGAHRGPEQAAKSLADMLDAEIGRLVEKDLDSLLADRHEKYRRLGVFHE